MEHKNILRIIKVVRKVCFNIMKGTEINYKDLEDIIEFIRNYADSHHHKKEEDILFNRITENLGQLGEKLVKHGMLVEHDYGRLYISNLKLKNHKGIKNRIQINMTRFNKDITKE